MIREDFFKKISEKGVSDKEKAVELLKARGFLIDKDEKGYYLSDNSIIEDLYYLKKILKEYSVGEIGGAKIKHCECGNHTLQIKNEIGKNEYSNDYDVLIDKTAYIKFNENIDTSKIYHIFDNEEYIGNGVVCSYPCSWKFFNYRSNVPKYPVEKMEPFVTRYMKSISSCCCYTEFSCDGNHKGKSNMTVRCKYPYNIWQRIIFNEIIPKEMKKFCKLEQDNKIFFDKNTQYEVYYELNNIAEYLYENRVKIKFILYNSNEFINKKFIKHNEKESIEKAFEAKCKEIIYCSRRN